MHTVCPEAPALPIGPPAQRSGVARLFGRYPLSPAAAFRSRALLSEPRLRHPRPHQRHPTDSSLPTALLPPESWQRGPVYRKTSAVEPKIGEMMRTPPPSNPDDGPESRRWSRNLTARQIAWRSQGGPPHRGRAACQACSRSSTSCLSLSIVAMQCIILRRKAAIGAHARQGVARGRWPAHVTTAGLFSACA
jgi:hypothetical protein